jgi:rare lipoprotein A (peptidoglycan hydrolase)
MKNTPIMRAARPARIRRRVVARSARHSRRLLAGLGLMMLSVRAGATDLPLESIDRTTLVAQDSAADAVSRDASRLDEADAALAAVPDHAPSIRDRIELGLASFYHRNFQGRRTASGHPLDLTAMTAAHRTLPLGTKIRITNLGNGRVAHATVTDRGPFAPGRVVDVTDAMARALGFLRSGLARVSVEVTGWEALPKRKRPTRTAR